MIYSMRVRLSHMMFFCLAPVIACCSGGAWQSLDKAEALLQDNPSESLAILDSLDSSSWGKRSRSRLILLKAIALDKNHINDGRLADEMEEATAWYQHVGNRENRLRAEYYYGDQLRGAGRNEESAVCFMRTEEEAARQGNWYMAGMSARSLFYVFARTYNTPEELASIKRAVDYFHRAGLEEHEDDARVKMALACYDGSLLETSDSLFEVAIATAMSKKDTVRLRKALSGSVDLFLTPSHVVPDSVISRLSRAEELGYAIGSRHLADYALAYSYLGLKDEAEAYLDSAYSVCKSASERAFVGSRELSIRESEGDADATIKLLKELDSYTNAVARESLKQSALKAQTLYLNEANEQLSHNLALSRSVLVLSLLSLCLLIVAVLLIYKRISDRHHLEVTEAKFAAERQRLEADRYILACDEMASFGMASIDSVGKAFYSAENNPASVVKAYGAIISRMREEVFMDRFLENVDRINNGVLTKLKTQIPSLSKSRVQLFAYLVQGFSYSTISVIMGSNQRQNLYDMRKRLIQTIEKSTAVDKNLFLQYLGKTPVGKTIDVAEIAH